MQGSLESLVREEIIEKVPDGWFAKESQYHFRHALVREAAYGLVSEEEKAAWHGEAGRFLEAAGEREGIILADHYRLGKELDRAARRGLGRGLAPRGEVAGVRQAVGVSHGRFSSAGLDGGGGLVHNSKLNYMFS